MKTPSRSFPSRLALPGLMSLILLAPAIAQADVFDVSGTAENVSGGTFGSCALGATCPFSGMLSIDTTTPGTVKSADISLPGLDSFDHLIDSFSNGADWEIIVESSTSSDALTLTFTTPGHTPPSLVGFTGGSITGDSDEQALYNINGGSITPASVPEPTSLLLLAGVIGWVVFDLKRRFRKKSAIHTLDSDRFADRGTI